MWFAESEVKIAAPQIPPAAALPSETRTRRSPRGSRGALRPLVPLRSNLMAPQASYVMPTTPTLVLLVVVVFDGGGGDDDDRFIKKVYGWPL